MQNKEAIVRECAVCNRWTTRGDHFASGPRNVATGETPVDNWICVPCQREAIACDTLNAAVDRWEQRQRAANGRERGWQKSPETRRAA